MTQPSPSSLPPAKFGIVDLFAGPGGLDIAAAILKDEGVESIGVEWDDATRATRAAAGLLTTEVKDVAALGPCDPSVVEATVLTGGPPCQSFSVAGSRKGHKALDDVLRLATRLADHEDEASFDVAWKEVKAETDAMSDDRTGFVLQPLRWIMEAKLKRRRPYEVVVLEQVPTVLPVWKHFVGILRRTGYAAEAHVLHSEDFGVPQTRRRAVLIAQFDPGNEHRKVRFPEATHQRYRKGAERLPLTHDHLDGSLFRASRSGGDVEPWVSMGDALRATRTTDFLMVSNYGSGGDPKNRGRRESGEPAPTITGKVRRNRLYHLRRNESGEVLIRPEDELDRLSSQEAGLLQSFPAEYPWRSTDVPQQIGNAIPPRLSLHILSMALLREPPQEKWYTLLKEWRPQASLPSATPPTAVQRSAPQASPSVSSSAPVRPRTGAPAKSSAK
ncbi:MULTISPECIES: DNA cytosine methyltransferase [unclassified Streptomyces]|uniref:DNA cytosine methyltransferase n=1 Tax=unclassified Streptomyces TaxID=2593676 RepID=UPI002E1196F4|nr:MULTISPECIES: DNA cytosine methyltransferase [unclassified Streptomyces]WSQ79663.1 DNA cytosine methyltransferase [Streptomyces sp. NBC_01213]WSQ87043.1 DNA cytosine methyltransferase [Streptomyces sp. NBC_01212]WSR50320.1 DNA cytosine methyltransferase [Streptomyces sp. NBC_01201]